MPIEDRPYGLADIVATAGDGRIVLIGEVKAMKSTGDIGILQTLEYLNDSNALFGMFADFDEIVFFRRDFEDPSSPILELKTAEVLSFYEPRFVEKRISEQYLATLIEGWLRDYAFHWKSERPPGYEEMTKIGLAEQLAGGMTSRETIHADHPLY